MSLDFINPLMLFGLLGLSLPILAHLLSKKKYDLIDWGAMQFLELGRNARRKLRLEELLLLLLRMGLIALIAFALARPWGSGGLFASLGTSQSRDVVIVIDGSYSMGWEGKTVTPHAAAIQWVHEFLEELNPGDTVALLDARDQVRPLIESPTQDFGVVREELNGLPPPSGSSNLAAASSMGLQILSRTSNLARDVVILTDGQARGWSAGDENLWASFDDLKQQPSVAPRVWVVNVGESKTTERINFSVDRLQLSRELAVTEFPVRISTKVQCFGGTAAIKRRVHLEVDGQRLTDKSLTLQMLPGGEATVEFEHRFASGGTHMVSVVLDEDNLPGDNRADAAVVVADALPVLLVDGTPHLDPTLNETFFAKAAFSSSLNETPWVAASVVSWERFTAADIGDAEVVVLANVPRLDDKQTTALKDYVAGGGGLMIALGDQVDAADYKKQLFEEGQGLLPAVPESIASDDADALSGAHVADASLELPWMTRFRAGNDGGFTDARFLKWWKTTLAASAVVGRSPDRPTGRHQAGRPAVGRVDGSGDPPTTVPVEPDEESESPDDDEGTAELPEATAPIVAARLETGDPLLITRRYGRGGVALLTVPIDADWSTLPAKPDYVSLLHELVFFLTSAKSSRNVDVGVPLVLPVSADVPLDEFAFFGPGNTEFPPVVGGDELHPVARLSDTRLPGIYTFKSRSKNENAAGSAEKFVVNFDRGESDLTPLDDAERKLLTNDGRMEFAGELDELTAAMLTSDAHTEFWYLLLFAFLAILVGEVVMTKRLVQGGHVVTDDEELSPEDVAEDEIEDYGELEKSGTR